MTNLVFRQTLENGGCVVLAPGLLTGVAHYADLPRVEHLRRLLGHADRSVTESPVQSLESLVINSLPATHQVAGCSLTCAAYYTHRLDFPTAPDRENHLMRADPAYQQIDMNNATLGNPAELALEPAECLALRQTLNEHFAVDGIRFEYAQPERWYCCFERSLQLSTTPISAAIGRDVAQCRPTGEDARLWRSKLAEIEMLLFDHPVNVSRQAQGQLPINTLWLWGEGIPDPTGPDSTALPLTAHQSTSSDSTVRAEAAVQVITDHFYTSSLAAHRDIAHCDLTRSESALTGAHASLFVSDKMTRTDTLHNEAAYKEQLQWFEQHVFEALWRNLSRAGWPEVSLWFGDKHLYRVDASAKNNLWRKLWFRKPSLAEFVTTDQNLTVPAGAGQAGAL